MNEEVKKYMAEIGRKGGKAATNQSEAGRSAWAKLTPEERSRIARERALKRWAKKGKDKGKAGE